MKTFLASQKARYPKIPNESPLSNKLQDIRSKSSPSFIKVKVFKSGGDTAARYPRFRANLSISTASAIKDFHPSLAQDDQNRCTAPGSESGKPQKYRLFHHVYARPITADLIPSFLPISITLPCRSIPFLALTARLHARKAPKSPPRPLSPFSSSPTTYSPNPSTPRTAAAQFKLARKLDRIQRARSSRSFIPTQTFRSTYLCIVYM